MISTRGRYGLRVMIELAKSDGERYVPLRDIAEQQGISKKYLEIIVKDLVSTKMIVGASGKGGGYKLARPAEDYSVGEIIELMEGSLATVACLKDGADPCPRESFCSTLPMWKEYNDLVHNFFYSKKLIELI